MRAISEPRRHTNVRPRSSAGSAPRWQIGLALLSAILLIGSTADADPRKTQLRSSSNSTVWFGRSAGVADAITAWKRGNTGEAVIEALGALEGQLQRSDFQAASSLVCMGRTAQGLADEAIPYCEKALRNRGDRDWRHVNNLANAQLQAGLHEEAIANYERSIQLIAESGRGLSGHRRAERTRLLEEVVYFNLDLAYEAMATSNQIAAGSEPEATDGPRREQAAPITRLAGSTER